MEMPHGIRTHQETPARERRACIRAFACHMAGFSVLPIRENCNTHLGILCHISEKACHIAGRTAAHGFPPHTAVYIFQSPYILYVRVRLAIKPI